MTQTPMNPNRRALGALLLAAGGTAAVPARGAATPPLVGTWTLVRVDNLLPDGSRVELYGPKPQGLLVFDAHGRYALQILRAERARFASNDKARGTAEEYADAVRGSNAHFGRYRVNPSDSTLSFEIEHASFANWEGTRQTRSFAIDGASLVYRVPTPTSGGNVVGEVEWRRADDW